tara:strand:- start:5796 stop:6371 length:576 start_codon:yes stop_codon:yes gene_type:complete
VPKFFRFDDICINADMNLANEMVDFLHETFNGCRVIFCVSPLVHDMSHEKGKHKQRIFPKILNAHSDHRKYFEADLCGIPDMRDDVVMAGHGLIHVDHRLMNKEAQELSIITSCSLAKAKVFVPPFNKWNKDTNEICKEHGIELVKFEDGWKCMEHESYDSNHDLWYLHHREFTMNTFKEWFNNLKKDLNE